MKITHTSDADIDDQIGVLLPLLGPPRLRPIVKSTPDHLYTSKEALSAMLIDLEETRQAHRSMLASNKDQQETAIAAFTMVTVVFLPLSWLSGIFGMNVIDIRNLEYGQWLYWIIAIPFAGVLGAGAWWLVGADQLAYLRRRRTNNRAVPLSALSGPRSIDQHRRRQLDHLVPVGEDTEYRPTAHEGMDVPTRRRTSTSTHGETTTARLARRGACDDRLRGPRESAWSRRNRARTAESFEV